MLHAASMSLLMSPYNKTRKREQQQNPLLSNNSRCPTDDDMSSAGSEIVYNMSRGPIYGSPTQSVNSDVTDYDTSLALRALDFAPDPESEQCLHHVIEISEQLAIIRESYGGTDSNNKAQLLAILRTTLLQLQELTNEKFRQQELPQSASEDQVHGHPTSETSPNTNQGISDRNLRLAAAYLQDAMNGRLQNGRGKSLSYGPLQQIAFTIHGHCLFKRTLQFVSLLYCGVLLIEPVRNKPQDDFRVAFAKWFELATLCVLWIDMLCRFIYMGRNVFKKGPLRLLVYVMLIATVDVVVALCRGPSHVVMRCSRVLRPVVFVIFDRQTLLLAQMSIKALLRLRWLIILTTALIIAFALVFNSLLSGTQSVSRESDLPFWQPFDGVFQSVVSLTSLIMLEFVVPYSARIDVLIVVALLFLTLSVVLLGFAVVVQVDEFRTQRAELAEKEAHKEYHALGLVYCLAQDPTTHVVSPATFTRLLTLYCPAISTSDAQVLFEDLDTCKDGTIDFIEFMRMCDVLRKEFHVPPASSLTNPQDQYQSQSQSQSLLPQAQAQPQPQSQSRVVWWMHTLRRRALATLNSSMYSSCMCAVVIANTGLLFQLGSGTSRVLSRVFACLDRACVVLFAVELCVRLFAMGPRTYFRNPSYKFWAFAVCFSVCATVLCDTAIATAMLSTPSSSDDAGSRFLVIGGAMRFLRILELFPSLVLYIRIISKVFPILIEFSKIFGSLMYMYGVIALGLFSLNNVQFNNVQFNSDSNNVNVNATSPGNSLRLITLESWHLVMFQMMEPLSPWQRVATVCMLMSLFLIQLLLLSQFTALLFDVFVRERSREQEQSGTNSGQPHEGGGRYLRLQRPRSWRQDIDAKKVDVPKVVDSSKNHLGSHGVSHEGLILAYRTAATLHQRVTVGDHVTHSSRPARS